jgi:hypothetical protein
MDLPAERSAEALKIAPADIKDMESETELTFPKREISQEDSILMKGGVLEKQSAIVSQDAKRVERQKSIRAEDWEGRGNLLVNELRAGNGFEVSLDQVEAFLRGEDLYGWSEGQRNWIADEMMTMLRQELPAKGYEIFSQIQADSSAPAAMRDYSIQHISHLIADGHVGKEGVAIIRAALESANPATASTALISLQRLSEKAPNLITATEVMSYANRYVDSPDTRLQISARSIQK